MISKTIELNAKQDTRDLAARIAPLLEPGDVIRLYGDLGSGKTFFASALGRELGIEEFLDSPSFVLLKEYQARDFPLYHLDLYRLKRTEDLNELGLFDILESGVTLIEWPELASGVIPERMLNLDLRFSYDGRRRTVEVLARGRFSGYFDEHQSNGRFE
ncbi:MAG: tRNA (adenosine(37)-N6)-threonylcarbamoyltransferase complex ATPase subunit type 1 TsaE [Candidatus Syntrophosphaera sp.]